jgi:hypothetical protein
MHIQHSTKTPTLLHGITVLLNEDLHCSQSTRSVVTSQLMDIKIKVKESRNRPGVAQKVPGGLGSQISLTFAT